jgi:hypothetical protein
LNINEIRNIASGDTQAERVTLHRGAVKKLIVRPHRRHGGHLVDNDLVRGCIAQHRQEGDRRIVGAIVDRGHTTLATKYRLTSWLGVSSAPSSKRPSLPVCV